MHKENSQIENVIVDFSKIQIGEDGSKVQPTDIMDIPGTAHKKLEILAQMAHK